MSKGQEVVEELVRKAGKSEKSDDALKFSQAACNAANALRQLAETGARTD